MTNYDKKRWVGLLSAASTAWHSVTGGHGVGSPGPRCRLMQTRRRVLDFRACRVAEAGHARSSPHPLLARPGLLRNSNSIVKAARSKPPLCPPGPLPFPAAATRLSMATQFSPFARPPCPAPQRQLDRQRRPRRRAAQRAAGGLYQEVRPGGCWHRKGPGGCWRQKGPGGGLMIALHSATWGRAQPRACAPRARARPAGASRRTSSPTLASKAVVGRKPGARRSHPATRPAPCCPRCLGQLPTYPPWHQPCLPGPAGLCSATRAATPRPSSRSASAPSASSSSARRAAL